MYCIAQKQREYVDAFEYLKKNSRNGNKEKHYFICHTIWYKEPSLHYNIACLTFAIYERWKQGHILAALKVSVNLVQTKVTCTSTKCYAYFHQGAEQPMCWCLHTLAAVTYDCYGRCGPPGIGTACLSGRQAGRSRVSEVKLGTTTLWH